MNVFTTLKNFVSFQHTRIPENVYCSRKMPTAKQILTKLSGDYHQNPKLLADGARISAWDRGVDGKCFNMVPKNTPPKDMFSFPSVESLSGESTTSSESDGESSSSSLSSSFSSFSSADDDLMYSGDVLSGICSEGGNHEVVSNESDSEDKFDLSSSNYTCNSEWEDTDAFVRHVSTPQCHNLTNPVKLAKFKKYKKLGETVSSKYLNEYKEGKDVHLRSKYAFGGGYFETSGKSLKENSDENDGKFSVYRLCKSDSGGSTYQRMCKSLKTVAKRNKRSKYFKITKVESSSSLEDLAPSRGYSNMPNYEGKKSYRHGYNGLCDYKVETELSSSSTDEVGFNLLTKKSIGISEKYRTLEGQEEDKHLGNMQDIQGERHHDDFLNNHGRYQTLGDNINNNANQDDTCKNHSPQREEGKNKYSLSSGNLVEEMQRKSQNKLKHRLVQLIKEQDKMLQELDFVETMKGRAVRGKSCVALDNTQWKLEMKAVENNYKMRVDGIVNDLKASMKSEMGSSTDSVKNKDIQKEPQKEVNNNADSRRAEQREEESSGFFRSLFRRNPKSTNQEENANGHAPTGFSLRKLFRRTRKVKDNGSSKQVSTEQDQEEMNKPKYEIFNEKNMSNSLKKLKRILKNMLLDFSNASDVDLLLEEAKLLAGVSDEMESVCNEEIARIETKFRRKFEKRLKTKMCKDNENYQDEKIEENVILDESEHGMSRQWRKL